MTKKKTGAPHCHRISYRQGKQVKTALEDEPREKR